MIFQFPINNLQQMKQTQYQNEKDLLRQMHLQRIARLAQNKMNQKQVGSKVIKKQDEKQDKSSNRYDKIYLNSVIYDQRSTKQKFNNITFANLLHQNVSNFPSKPFSKNIEAIMITTYGFQHQVFQPIAQSGIPLFIFNRQAQSKEGSFINKYSGFPNITLISPPKLNSGYGVFHIKLWIIKFKTFIRVVVCTGNHHLHDWTIWQNAYWFHDCQLIDQIDQKIVTIGSSFQKQEEKPTNNGQKEGSKQKLQGQAGQFDFGQDFRSTLKWVISSIQPKNYNVLDQMKVNLDQYSFANIKVILIPSLVGRFKGEQLQKVGLGKIKKIMTLFNKQFKDPILTCNCSSLGKIDQKIIKDIFYSFSPNNKQLFSPLSFRLIYPTMNYIQKQTCGEASVLFLTPENYQKCQNKQNIFYKYQPSVYNGVAGGIPHLKTIIIEEKSINQNNPNDKDDGKIILYLGSHNLTRAAWGTFQKNGSQLNFNNEELGLLFVDYSRQQLLKWLPFRYPPNKYEIKDLPFLRKFQ